MGKAKLNIWVRDKHCRIINRTGHLHIYNCLGEEVFFGWVIKAGHAEVEIPPGCYIVRAGMRGGNIYSDRCVVIVRCGDVACVNLILPNFVEGAGAGGNPQVAPRKLLVGGGCVPPVILALGIEAQRKNIDPQEAFNVLIKAAEIDRGQMTADVENEIQEMSENIDEVTKEEREEVKEYMGHLKKIRDMLGRTGEC